MPEQRQGGGFLKEEFAGIPGWIWLAGAAVVVGGYLYLRRSAATGQGAQQQTAQQGQGAPQVTLIPFQTITKTWHKQHHKSPPKGKLQNTDSSGDA